MNLIWSDWKPCVIRFDGFRTKNTIERAKISVDKIRNEEVELKRALELQVQNAKIEYKTALQSIATAKRNLELAQKIYNTTLIKYREGIGSSIETIQAERDVYTAQANYNNAIYSVVVAKSGLDNAVGKR